MALVYGYDKTTFLSSGVWKLGFDESRISISSLNSFFPSLSFPLLGVARVVSFARFREVPCRQHKATATLYLCRATYAI